MQKKTDYRFGANILENLTTGMYQDSKIIYREYIQNSCDSIDEAVQQGIIADVSEAEIELWLDFEARTIIILDNGTGIPASEFQDTLGDIADSDKEMGKNKGFRGIGRLCGLAYCKEVVFSTSAKGENIISEMRCDAKKMRHLLSENTKGNKKTAVDVLQAVNEYYTEETKDINSHFFKVELIDINYENQDLLDEDEIRDYLSFVAPVPYQNTFIFRNSIYNHANEIGVALDEYTIRLEGKQIFKRFSTYLKKSDGKSHDEIFDIAFKDFYDADNNLFAWMWVGLSSFKGAIPKNNQMRGLRLRKENIQIGGEDALQKLFKEDRGNSYFVGEVFAVSLELVPNSQRDYFNENPARADFERILKRFFEDELHRLYYEGSTINSAHKKISAYENKVAYYKQKDVKNAFVNEAHRELEVKKIEEAKKEAEAAQKRIEKVKVKASEKPDSLINKVVQRIETVQTVKQLPTPSVIMPEQNVNTPRRVDKLSQYSRAERKLISKIFELILSATDDKTAEMIISKVENGLAQ